MEKILIFARQAGFAGLVRVQPVGPGEAGDPTGVGGYFNPHAGEIVLFVEPGAREEEILILLAHEIGHARRGLDETAANLEIPRILAAWGRQDLAAGLPTWFRRRGRYFAALRRNGHRWAGRIAARCYRTARLLETEAGIPS